MEEGTEIIPAAARTEIERLLNENKELQTEIDSYMEKVKKSVAILFFVGAVLGVPLSYSLSFFKGDPEPKEVFAMMFLAGFSGALIAIMLETFSNFTYKQSLKANRKRVNKILLETKNTNI